MGKYRTYLQEDLRTYDNPLNETISKTIFSYLKFYGYVQIRKGIRYINRTYKVLFSNGTDYAVLNFGDNIAVLTEFYGKSEITPRSKIDFIKQEKLEYIGAFKDKCIIYTFDKFSKSCYYGPINYQGMKNSSYYNNDIPDGTTPDGVKIHEEYPTIMMRLVASGDYANEIRCLKEEEPVYYGKQIRG